MLRFISEVVGSNIILFQENAQVGIAKGVIIDPNNGSFLGLTVFDPIAKQNKVIPSSEIKGTGKGAVLISDYNSLADSNDVVRIKAALEINPKIVGSRVETQSGQFLGKVSDATIDFALMCLSQLYVTPSTLLKYFSKDLIIPAKKIIEIQKNKIIVSDEYVTISGKETVQVASPAAE